MGYSGNWAQGTDIMAQMIDLPEPICKYTARHDISRFVCVCVHLAMCPEIGPCMYPSIYVGGDFFRLMEECGQRDALCCSAEVAPRLPDKRVEILGRYLAISD